MAKDSTPTTTVTWDISSLERVTATGEIQTVHYTVNATDGVYRAGAYGSIGLDPADPDNMVPYSEISKEQCLSWLLEKVGEETISSIKEALEKQISEQRNPTRAQGLPWPNQTDVVSPQ